MLENAILMIRDGLESNIHNPTQPEPSDAGFNATQIHGRIINDAYEDLHQYGIHTRYFRKDLAEKLAVFACVISITRMWANAQRDGRPAEYRWRRLFNAAKFG